MTIISDRASCPECRAIFRGGYVRCPRDGAQLVPAEIDPLVGTVLAERYQIESVIGEGGIGRVYRARHVRMSRRFAIKVPFGELAYDNKVRARFLNEAEATSRLSHRNVVGVVDIGESSQGLLYMAMDLAEGISLADVIHREGPQKRARVLSITQQIAEGLEHAHERGLIHRDLKPENIILVRDDGAAEERVCIVDFGIAILRDAEGNSGRLTTEGIVLGTPHYMSPEQACNQPIDHRTDIFALGLICYEMQAGVLPFDGTPIEVARRNLGSEPPRLTQRVLGLVVDPYLQALAFWMLEKRPEDRPQRAAEVVEVLRLIQTNPAAAAAKLGLGEIEEVVDLPVPVPEIDNLPAPRAASARAKTPAPLPVTPEPQIPLPVAEIYDVESEPEREKPRKWWLAIAIALLFFGGVMLLVMLSSTDRRATADAPQPAAKPDAAPVLVAQVPVDAGVAPPIDAAPAPVPVPIDAGTKKKPPPPRKRDAGAGVVKPPEPPVSKATLTALYESVGRQLNKLIASKGEAAAVEYKKAYAAVPYLEAVRKEEMRSEAMKSLRDLQRRMPK